MLFWWRKVRKSKHCGMLQTPHQETVQTIITSYQSSLFGGQANGNTFYVLKTDQNVWIVYYHQNVYYSKCFVLH